jgi:hypothetical protein
VGKTVSGKHAVAGFAISGAEPSFLATRELVLDDDDEEEEEKECSQ